MAEHWVLDYYREIFMGFIKGYDSNIFLFKLNVGLGISCLVVIYTYTKNISQFHKREPKIEWKFISMGSMVFSTHQI